MGLAVAMVVPSIPKVAAANFDYTLSLNSTSASLVRGSDPMGADSAEVILANVSAALTAGTAQPVTFSAAGVPNGVFVSFYPPSCPPPCSSLVGFKTRFTAPSGLAQITISAAPLGLTTQTVTFSLTVLAPAASRIQTVVKPYIYLSNNNVNLQNWQGVPQNSQVLAVARTTAFTSDNGPLSGIV